MKIKSWIPLLLVGLLSACGPKAQVRPEFAGEFKPTVAILPAEYPDGVQRERVDYLREILRLELANSGYLVLDDRLVRKTCSAPDCPERDALARKYKTNTFFDLDVDSNSEVNFLAGYYNSISGRLRMLDVQGQEAVKIEHTEREKGGVVFESGQVLQGIINQVKNSDPESANLLGIRFIRRLVSVVPKPSTDQDFGNIPVRITSTTAAPGKITGVRKVCVEGTGAAVAALHLGPHRAGLRETNPGTYCGIFRLDGRTLSNSKAIAELRSPFGASSRKELGLSS